MNSKLKSIRQKIRNSHVIIKNFGLIFGIENGLNEIIIRGHGKIGKKLNHYHYENAKKIIKKKYFEQLEFSSMNLELQSLKKITDDCPIWIFWWQGIDNAPIVVKAALESIVKHSRKHPVLIITKENVEKYADIPEHIYRKKNEGKITITHFSDILRAQLLYQHGGIWMDSTLFATGDFNENMYSKAFYSIQHGQRAEYHVCKGKWSGFFLACGKGNPIFNYLSKAFYLYWEKENCLICYLLIDCFLALGYENIDTMRKLIDDIGVNNTGVFEMASQYNEIYSIGRWKEICSSAYLHKLSYKLKISDYKNTIYNHIVR